MSVATHPTVQAVAGSAAVLRRLRPASSMVSDNFRVNEGLCGWRSPLAWRPPLRARDGVMDHSRREPPETAALPAAATFTYTGVLTKLRPK